MIPYLVGGLIVYTAYNVHKIWDDLVSYSEMKVEEYTRLYTYDKYDLTDKDKADADRADKDKAANADADNKAEETDDISPFKDDIYMQYTISLFDRWKQEATQAAIGIYFDALTLYCAFENEWMKRTKTNYIVYSVHSILKYVGKLWKWATCGHFIEPDADIWIDSVSMYRVKQEDGTFVYNTHDSYRYYTHATHIIGEFLSELKRCIEKKPPVGGNDVPVGIIDIIAHMVIGKYTEKDGTVFYIVSQVPDAGHIQKSTAGFMSIEYTHPLMEDTIPLELPHEMHISGNTLFTSAFVLRALKHQSKPFIFDMDYKIKVVDAMVNIFELKSDECILLRENGYEVKKQVVCNEYHFTHQ